MGVHAELRSVVSTISGLETFVEDDGFRALNSSGTIIGS